jgi:ATP-dependent RNA helicase MSS116
MNPTSTLSLLFFSLQICLLISLQGVEGYSRSSSIYHKYSLHVGHRAAFNHRLHLSSLSSSSSSDDDYDYNYEEGDAVSPRRRRLPNIRVRPKRPSATNDKIAIRQEEAKVRHQQALQDPTLLSNVNFSDRSDISPPTKRAITEVMGLQTMTEIQAKTYAAALAGECVLGRARTGTGKTLAFLLPTIERLLAADLDLYKPGRSIGAIIVAPTRELAIQIADQAETLLTYYNDMTVACIYGGTKIQRDNRLLSGPRMPAILVATPGRLLEHLENTRINRRKFQDIAAETRIVVLDETDRLFDGFYKDTTKILSFLPRAEKRQTLLFSATFPRRFQAFLKESMKINFTQIDCVGRGDKKAETNTRVDQTYYMLENMEEYVTMLVAIIANAMESDQQYKILVFFPASKLVRFFVKLFNEGLRVPVLEIHSRMSQASRNRASSTFRSAKNAVMFSSDVSARGVDYPDVSLVIQVSHQIFVFFVSSRCKEVIYLPSFLPFYPLSTEHHRVQMRIFTGLVELAAQDVKGKGC